jgi:hypothetical protein
MYSITGKGDNMPITHDQMICDMALAHATYPHLDADGLIEFICQMYGTNPEDWMFDMAWYVIASKAEHFATDDSFDDIRAPRA